MSTTSNNVRALVIAAAAAATVATLTPSAYAGVTGGTGQQYLVQTTGATALRAFTSAEGNRGTYLLGQDELQIGGSTYTLGSTGQALGRQILNNGSPIEPPIGADRLVYGYHETGSINGVLDLARRNGLFPGTAIAVTGSNPHYAMGEERGAFPTTYTNGYSNFYDSTPQTAPVPGVPGAFYDFNTDAKPIPQISFSDVRFEQAFRPQTAAAGTVGARPTTSNYGQSRAPGLAGFNDGAVSFQRLGDASQLTGGIGATTNLQNTSLAVVPFTISANPGTGLDSISEADGRFLQAAGRLQNGADFASVTRDVGSGTRNQGGNNLLVDPSWASGDRDRVIPAGVTPYQTTDVDGNVVTLGPGDEGKPGVDLRTGASGENPNEHRPSLYSTNADKRSGSGALRPRVLSSRMGLGVLSVGDVGSRGRSTGTTDPLRVLAIDFEGADNADGVDAGAVQPRIEDVTSGRYQLWSASQAVTVSGSLANGATAEGQLTGGSLIAASANPDGTIFNDVDDDGSGTGVVKKFLDNITGDTSLQSFGGGLSDAFTPIDAIIAAGFIPVPLMEVDKAFDGDTQVFTPRSAAAQAVYDSVDGNNQALGSNLDWIRAGDHDGAIDQQVYRIFDVENNTPTRSPTGNIEIGFTERLFLAGDLNGDQVRDLEDVEAWADAVADTSAFLAANPDIQVRDTNNDGSVTLGDIEFNATASTSGAGSTSLAQNLTPQEYALVALSDLNGDGNTVAVGEAGSSDGQLDQVEAIDREDVRYFLYGAAVDTSDFSTAQEKRELGVRQGQLRKNEAIDRFNARLDAIGADPSLKFDKFDVNNDGVSNFVDVGLVDGAAGLDYTSLDDVLSTSTDLVAAELDDDNVITYGNQGPAASDVESIVNTLADAGRFVRGDATFDGTVNLQDFLVLRANFNNDATYSGGNFNFDDNVDLQDFLTLRSNFNQSAGISSFSAPTPAGESFEGELIINIDSGEISVAGEGELVGVALFGEEGAFDVTGLDLSTGLGEIALADDVIALGNLGSGIDVEGLLSLGNVLAGVAGLEGLSAQVLDGQGNVFYLTSTVVPEPTSLAVLALGGLALRRRRSA